MRDAGTRAPAIDGREPAAGRPEMDLPGADQEGPSGERWPGDTPQPGDTPDPVHAPRPAGEPDLVPDVEVPEETM